MILARLENNTVAEIVEIPDLIDGEKADPAKLFHSSLRMVPVPDAVRVGWVWDGKKCAAPATPDENVGDAVARALAAINHRAEKLRGAYITGGDGQAIVYQLKAAEVAKFGADKSPKKNEYRWIALEADLNGVSMTEAAARISSAASQSYAGLLAIEQARMGAIAAVKAGKTPADVASALQAVVWP